MRLSSLPWGCVGRPEERPISAVDWLAMAAERRLDGVEIMDYMKNTMRENENPLVILEKPHVLDRVLYTHVDNYRPTAGGWERSITVDAGEVDIRRLVLGLKAHGYDGRLSVEYGGKDIAHVFQSVEWLRSVWQCVLMEKNS